MKRVPLILLAFFIGSLVYGQCGKFADSPEGDEGLKYHTLYRDYIRNDNLEEAFPLWQKAYKIAPAADGKRASHFTDGIKIYKHFLEQEEDDAKRTEYAEMILRLYDERIECYDKEGYVLGRKASAMLYYTESSSKDLFETAKKSVELQNLKTEYIVLYPYATAVVALYKEGEISPEDAREAYKKINEIADHNIVEQTKYHEKYKDAKESANQLFEEIAQGANGQPALFDCTYFVEQEKADYQLVPYTSQDVNSLSNDALNAIIDDMKPGIEELESVLGRLKGNGCDESNAYYKELWTELKTRRTQVVLCEKKIKQTISIANRTEYDWGMVELRAKNFDKAMTHFEKAIVDAAESNENKADAAHRMAIYYYGTKGQKSKARGYARKAIGFRPNWAAPYVLIGEMYASSGKDCGKGTGFESQRTVWVAIDKWRKGISLEPNSESAKRAQKLINKYTQYMPTQEDCFMRSLKKGQSYTVGCWINETTTIRYVK